MKIARDKKQNRKQEQEKKDFKITTDTETSKGKRIWVLIEPQKKKVKTKTKYLKLYLEKVQDIYAEVNIQGTSQYVQEWSIPKCFLMWNFSDRESKKKHGRG